MMHFMVKRICFQAEIVFGNSGNSFLQEFVQLPLHLRHLLHGGTLDAQAVLDDHVQAAQHRQIGQRVPVAHDEIGGLPRLHGAGDAVDVRQPGVVCWVKTLQRGDLHILDPNRRIHFRISGMQYGDKDFFVNDSFSDSLTFQAGLLDELSCKWQERIVREIDNCEKAAQCVGYLAQDIAIAAGNKNENVGISARAQFYFRIDRPFRQWLQKIDANQKNYNEMEQGWQKQARSITEKLGEQMVMEAGNAALKGHRIVVDKDKKTERTILYTSPRAYNRFRARLWEIYPKTEP